MKKQHRRITIVFLFVIAMIIMLATFSYNKYLEQSLWENNLQTIEEIKYQQIMNFDIKLQADVELVENHARFIGGYHLANGEEHLKEILFRAAETSHFEFFGFADMNGDVITHNGETANVADRIYFQTSINGETRISRPLESRVFENEKLVTVISTPVYSQNNEIIGVFFGAYKTEELNKLLLSSMQGDNFAVVLTDIGELIAVSSDEYYGEAISNVKEFYDGKKIVLIEGDDTATVIANLKNNGSGYAVYIIDGEKKVLLYDSIDTNNWNIFSITSAQSLTAISDDITMRNLSLNTLIVILFLGLFSFILYSQIKNEKQLKKTAYYDSLTELPNKAMFEKNIKTILMNHPKDKFACVVFDIANFKLINDFFGTVIGDKVLISIAKVVESYVTIEPKGSATMARIHSDMFAVFLKIAPNNGSDAKKNTFIDDCRNAIDFIDDFKIDFYLGRYIVGCNDNNDNIIEKTMIAHSAAKDSGINIFIDYDEAFVDELKAKNEILNSFETALENKEFEMYLQPQYDAQTEQISGAELLVRWIKNGKIKHFPNDFIPVFEEAGVIYKLDSYLREQACITMHKWKTNNISHPPISVNVSRIELLQDGFVTQLVTLLDKYEVAHSMLHIEVTETVYARDNIKLANVVKDLQQNGFIVEMDDFGSGYSSLNALKDIPIDVVKLDMKFVETGENAARSGSILSSAIRLSQGIGVETVAEGVETREQADYLRSIGCDVIQGYYYAKPMPTQEFEELIRTKKVFEKKEKNEHTGINFLDASSQETLLFNTFLGGAAIIEYSKDNIHVLRANNKFIEGFGKKASEKDVFNVNLFDKLPEEHKLILASQYEHAIKTGEEVSSEVRIFIHGEYVWQTYSIRKLTQKGNVYIFYLSLSDITERKNIEQSLIHKNEEITSLHDNVPGAVFYSKNTPGFEVVFANNSFYEFIGYTPEEFKALHGNNMKGVVHLDDWDTMLAVVAEQLAVGNTTKHTHRLVAKDGTVKWILIHTLLTDNSDYGEVFYCTFVDVTSQKILEKELKEEISKNKYIIENMPGGYGKFKISGQDVTTLSISESLCKLLEYTQEEMINIGMQSLVHPDDAQIVTSSQERLLNNDKDNILTCRYISKSGKVLTFNCTGYFTKTGETSGIIDSSFYDVTDYSLLREKLETDKFNMQHMLNAIAGGVLTMAVCPNGTFEPLFVSDNVLKMEGYTKDEYMKMLLSKNIPIHPDDAPNAIAEIQKTALEGKEIDINYRFKHKDGHYFWISHKAIRFGEHNGLPVVLSLFQDLDQSANIFKVMLDNVDTIFVVVDPDKHNIFYMNKKAKDFAFLGDDEYCDQKCYEYLFGYRAPCHHCKMEDGENYACTTFELDERNYEVSFTPILWNGKKASIKKFIDITDRVKELQQIKRQAQLDLMTEIYNRGTAEKLIRDSMSKNDKYSLAMIDMDNLKIVNDTYGHTAGDEALKQIAAILKSNFRRSGDIVARFGGDEFLVFSASILEETSLVGKLNHLISRFRLIDIGCDAKISCSVGAIIGDKSSDFDEIYKKLDETLYIAKADGKNRIFVYHEKKANNID